MGVTQSSLKAEEVRSLTCKEIHQLYSHLSNTVKWLSQITKRENKSKLAPFSGTIT